MTERAVDYYGLQFGTASPEFAEDSYRLPVVISSEKRSIHTVKNKGKIVTEKQLKDGLDEFAQSSFAKIRQEHIGIPKMWRWSGLHHSIDAVTTAMLKPLRTGAIEDIEMELLAPDELPEGAFRDADRFLSPTQAGRHIKFPEATVYSRFVGHLLIGSRHTETTAGLVLYPHLDKHEVYPMIQMSVRTLSWSKVAQPAHELYQALSAEARDREAYNRQHPYKVPGMSSN